MSIWIRETLTHYKILNLRAKLKISSSRILSRPKTSRRRFFSSMEMWFRPSATDLIHPIQVIKFPQILLERLVLCSTPRQASMLSLRNNLWALHRVDSLDHLASITLWSSNYRISSRISSKQLLLSTQNIKGRIAMVASWTQDNNNNF